MRFHHFLLLIFCIIWASGNSYSQETRLLRNPDISSTHATFVYANDLWIYELGSTEARRLTTFPGTESNPHFSPDGKMIAFTGQYDGNTDVYVMSITGGEPKRLTWHPGPDVVRGWTNNGKRVVFVSGRNAQPRPYITKFWTVSMAGDWPLMLPIPRIEEGKFSPDAKRFVYQMIRPWEAEFRNYRGGQNNPIRIIDLQSFEIEKLPWDGANDQIPVWIGNKIFFLSDRDYAMNIWSYDLSSKELKQNTFFKEFDCKQLESGNGKMIFENGGYLYTLDSNGGNPEKLTLTAVGDFPWARPHWEKVGNDLGYDPEDPSGYYSYAISPTGKRAIFSARGDIFTVPAEKGDIRNITSSSGIADRTPAWSNGGKKICWFSDKNGEYQLIVADQFGNNKRSYKLENPTFFYTPVWSPDDKYISYGDADRNLLVLNLKSGKTTLIDNGGFAHPWRTIYPEWSPDSKWIAYTKRLENQFNAIFIFSLEENKSSQLTDGLSDCRNPRWDAGGKYIYFFGSTDFALNVGWLDLSSTKRPLNRVIYLAVLSSKDPSPLLPESDDEILNKKEDNDDDNDNEEQVEVVIDFKDIQQRIIALDIPARYYKNLQSGENGKIFFTEDVPNEKSMTLQKYDLKERKAEEFVQGIFGYDISSDGKKVLYTIKNKDWFIVDTDQKPEEGKGKINTADMQIKVNPAAEWKQIFNESWRFQRDYFYVENIHGLDMDWAYKTYSPWIDHVRHRNDLTYVLDILGGETSIGHSFVGGGDIPDVEKVPIGLLGADYEIDNGYYRIKKIYTGENWNPDLISPLSGPGINVKEGDYIVAVNGRELKADVNIYSRFDQTANKQISVSFNNKPKFKGARAQTIVPIPNETGLRARDWIESNRRKVDELSNGKLAYVWVPNTGMQGYDYFNRYYFAQMHKKGAIIDERFNHGGSIADYIVDLLARDLLGYFNNPVGDKIPFKAPNAAIFGPKVMIINESAGSGGDMLPYMFKLRKVGPLVGTRTWGGLVGIWDVPPLIDGGYITAPRGGFYNVDGEWDVENIGVSPNYEVEMDPKLVNQGHDPQLEKAIEVGMELLKENEVILLPQPPDPIRVKRPGK